MIIAIDGPAGAGKGTLAKRLAQEYHLGFLDTGALYRAVALSIIMNDGDATNENDAIRAAQGLDFGFAHIGENEYHAFIDGNDVEAELRTIRVGETASKIATITPVREALREFQLNFIKRGRHGTGAVLDGRDIGTIICPNADLKFFLDASSKVRAERRFKEIHEKGQPADFDEIHQLIIERDNRDRNRKDAPLVAASDAVVIDTSYLDADEVFAKAVELANVCRDNAVQ